MAQKFNRPAPLHRIEPEVQLQRRIARQEETRQAGRHRSVGERRDECIRKLCAVGSAGALPSRSVALDERDAMAFALQEVGRSQADHAGADDTDVHRTSLEANPQKETRGKKRARLIALNLAAGRNYFAGSVLVTVRLTVPSALMCDRQLSCRHWARS